jgi:hypothetical protein
MDHTRIAALQIALPLMLPRPWQRWIIIVLIIVVVLLLGTAILSWWIGSLTLLFIAQMGLLTVAVCVTPTVTRLVMDEQSVARVAVETLVFVALLSGFGLWVFGKSALGVWIAFAAGLVLLLEIGAWYHKWYQGSVLTRLEDDNSRVAVSGAISAIEKMSDLQVVVHIPVP